MSSSAAIPSAEQPLIVRDDHFCFGSGRLNAHGLQLHFAVTPERDGVWAPFTPSRAHEGFAAIVHGGIVTAVLDEVMGWALFARGIWAVTATIEVKFRKPVAVDVATRAIGRISRDRGRILQVSGELRRESDDLLLAQATGSFVRVPESQAQAWRDRYLLR